MRTGPSLKIGICLNRNCKRHGAVAQYMTPRGLRWLSLVCGVGLTVKQTKSQEHLRDGGGE